MGAGISGLTLAWALRERGTPVTLFEAAGRVGGQIRSWLDEGFVLEAGPNGFLDRDGAVGRLSSRLGIAEQMRSASVAADRRALFVRGKVRFLPSKPPELVGSNIVPWWAKLRLLLEPLSRRGPAGVDESLGQFGRRHLGRHVTETLLDAVQTGIFGGDLERLSVQAAFPRLHQMERSHRSLLLAAKAMRRTSPGAPLRLGSFEGGLETLPRALGSALGGSVRLGLRVRALERAGDTWQVRWDGGGERFDRVVLALPPGVSARLLRPLDSSIASALEA
ncbi:MAG TPA: protoporphyrinogen oxidase, partial [Myxococcaceae bacterium]|nr:protoporphyrinogen oxidase [Myxococcaceae bacterium]